MGTAFYNIFIMPIELFVELVFTVMNLMFHNPGFAIVFVSLAVQLLCFPLYKRADDIQEQERLKQKEMKPWLDHIKKTFKGDERFMMQQAYYRIENYKPFYAVKGSISLLLQIPFFIAAYHFLSNLSLLKGASFFAISDLSQPDGLIHIGTMSLNILPILMTVFNIISGIIYTKGFPLKDKIQTYGLACLFLVILYKSPSGLVFYWTLNNLFSLLKNVFLKITKNPVKIICIIGSVFSVMFIAFRIYLGNSVGIYKILVIYALAVACLIPLAVYLIKKNILDKKPIKTDRIESEGEISKNERTIFYLASVVFTMVLGLLIPANIVSSSPTEFDSLNYGPLGLIINVACVFVGFILVWGNIFYVFFNKSIKKIMMYIVSVAATAGTVTYLFFAKKLGIISHLFYFDVYPTFATTEKVLNILVVLVVAVIAVLIVKKKPIIIKRVFQIMIITLALSTVVNFFSINKKLASVNFKETDQVSDEYEKLIPLSKKGKNVVFLMLDRAISGYVPYIFNEKPELKESFDGFTYYPNTLTFGYSTNYATPALFGGYEYTVSEINERKDESLKDKQNEALKVLPALFSSEGYKVTVFDPPYANYKIPSDISIYDNLDGVNAYLVGNRYLTKADPALISVIETKQMHNFVCYSFMKTMPVFVQNVLYDGGNYYSSNPQINYGLTFLGDYAVMDGLTQMTTIQDTSEGSLFMLQNSITHQPSLLKTPEYEPSLFIENENVDMIQKTDLNGNTLSLSTDKHKSHYETNMAAFIKVGKWLDYLKENGIYDNTKIIIVSDHGFSLNQFDYEKAVEGVNLEKCNALLMVKDFNSKGFTVSDRFMTTADAPVNAVTDVIDNPVNPFTGKVINDSEKAAHPQIITTSGNLFIDKNNGNVFDTSDGEWWSVKDNIFDEKNWKKVEVN